MTYKFNNFKGFFKFSPKYRYQCKKFGIIHLDKDTTDLSKLLSIFVPDNIKWL